MTEVKPTKFVGGVSDIEVTSISNITATEGIIINEESLFRDPSLIYKIDILEDKSSYKEQTNIENGIAYVRHTLNIVLRREVAINFLDDLSSKYIDGVVAIVTTMANERLLVGISERFGLEEPLRLQKTDFNTGISSKEYPTFSLTLQCDDTEYAKNL